MLTFNFSANVSHIGLGNQRVNDPGLLVCSFGSGLHRVSLNGHGIVKPYIVSRTFVKIAYRKFNFLFLNQNICCGHSKEPSQ